MNQSKAYEFRTFSKGLNVSEKLKASNSSDSSHFVGKHSTNYQHVPLQVGRELQKPWMNCLPSHGMPGPEHRAEHRSCVWALCHICQSNRLVKPKHSRNGSSFRNQQQNETEA